MSFGTPRRPRRGLFIGFLVAIGLVALVTVGAALAQDKNIPLHNDTAGTSADCPNDGNAYWHFVISPNNGHSAFVEFHLNVGGTNYDISTWVQNGGQDDNVFVLVPAGTTLGDLDTTDSSADITWDGTGQEPTKFQLSHVCPGDLEAVAANISTEIHNGATDSDENPVDVIANGSTIPLGSTVHDSASLTTDPTPSDIPAGSSITFYFYEDGTCDDSVDGFPGDDTWKATKSYDVGSLSSPKSIDANDFAQGPLAAGQYSFRAFFTSGDSDKMTDATSDCEPFSVDKGDTTSTTTIVRNDTSAELGIDPIPHVPLGTTVHDTATVGDKVDGISMAGTLTYHFYTGTDCVAANEVGTGEDKSVDADGVAADSSDHGPLAAGNYSFNAEYGGNDDYNASGLSACEPLIVDKDDLTIRTDIHDTYHAIVLSVFPGTTVHDTATLGSTTTGFNPDLTKVSFTWFTNGTCYGTGTSVTNAGNEGTYVAKSGEKGPLASGSYSFSASFAGDDNYNAVGPATCEPLTVQAINGLTPGYWKNHLADSTQRPYASHPWFDASCGTTALKNAGGSCSTNGPWAKQYLPKLLGNYSVDTILKAAQVFNAMNCGSSTDQSAIGCLAGHLLATKLNLANGSLACPSILQTVADADAFLKGQTVNGVVGINYVGPSGSYTLTAAQRAFAISLKTKLDNYNNSISCP